MKSVGTALEAFGICEGIAESRALATARSEYGDGYRAAAEHIAAAIRAQKGGEAPSELERELHEAEIEARTFARVINAAVLVVESSGEQTPAAEAIRALVHTFFSDNDLPPALRHQDRGSTTRLSERASGTVSSIGSRAASRGRAVANGPRRSSVPPFDPSV